MELVVLMDDQQTDRPMLHIVYEMMRAHNDPTLESSFKK